MSTLEKKITDIALKRIRRARSTGDEEQTSVPAPKTAEKVSLREARLSDFEKVCALNTRLGLGPDSEANWKHLWLDNPALGAGESPVIGWVLEAAHAIVGFMGSIRTLHEYQGQTLVAAATCRLAVEVEYRASTPLLITSFFRQKNVDLFLNTTAIVSAGKMMQAFKAAPLPQKDYGTVLFWVIGSRHFAQSALRKLGIESKLSGAPTVLASLALQADIGFRGRAPRAKSPIYKIVETSVNDLGQEYRRFWEESSKDSSRMRARRTPEIVRWHFDPPGNRRSIRVLGCYLQNRLVGYGIVRHDQESGDGLRRSTIADFMAENDDPQIIDPLLTAIFTSAKDAGNHVLEVMGFPEEVRKSFLRWRPYSRNYPACPYFFKARDAALQEKLTDENAWYACPFDGDATIWP